MRIIDADSLKEKVSYQTRKIVDQEPTVSGIDKEELERYIEAGFCEGYEKAIDDFETKILGNCESMIKDEERVIVIRADIFKFVLKQLKAGGKNG